MIARIYNFICDFLNQIVFQLRGEINISKLIHRGLKVGKNLNIQPGVRIDYSHCWHIEIGDDVTLAPRVMILSHDASMKRQIGYTRIGKVKIGNGVFIGAGTIVLPNVKIGDNSIIGAGSVVTKNIPENVVAAGNPARVLCTLNDFLRKHNDSLKTSPIFGDEYTLRQNVNEKMKVEMNKRMIAGFGWIK